MCQKIFSQNLKSIEAPRRKMQTNQNEQKTKLISWYSSGEAGQIKGWLGPPTNLQKLPNMVDGVLTCQGIPTKIEVNLNLNGKDMAQTRFNQNA